jgi:hypothetical protein
MPRRHADRSPGPGRLRCRRIVGLRGVATALQSSPAGQSSRALPAAAGRGGPSTVNRRERRPVSCAAARRAASRAGSVSRCRRQRSASVRTRDDEMAFRHGCRVPLSTPDNPSRPAAMRILRALPRNVTANATGPASGRSGQARTPTTSCGREVSHAATLPCRAPVPHCRKDTHDDDPV